MQLTMKAKDSKMLSTHTQTLYGLENVAPWTRLEAPSPGSIGNLQKRTPPETNTEIFKTSLKGDCFSFFFFP